MRMAKRGFSLEIVRTGTQSDSRFSTALVCFAYLAWIRSCLGAFPFFSPKENDLEARPFVSHLRGSDAIGAGSRTTDEMKGGRADLDLTSSLPLPYSNLEGTNKAVDRR